MKILDKNVLTQKSSNFLLICLSENSLDKTPDLRHELNFFSVLWIFNDLLVYLTCGHHNRSYVGFQYWTGNKTWSCGCCKRMVTSHFLLDYQASETPQDHHVWMQLATKWQQRITTITWSLSRTLKVSIAIECPQKSWKYLAEISSAFEITLIELYCIRRSSKSPSFGISLLQS